MERLEAKKGRSPIGSLKFQKKSDYKKFRNFIKKSIVSIWEEKKSALMLRS